MSEVALRQENDLTQRLARRGLLLRRRGRVSDQILAPGKPGDGREVGNTVVAMRAQKDW